MDFSAAEIERYARHLVLAELGGAGQQRLKRSRLLVVGAGGLGAPLIQYAAAAGVGTIGIVDDDVVSLSNLQRQVIHRTSDIGRPKVERAAEAVAELNPHVAARPLRTRLTTGNARALVRDFDIVADCSDNLDTRYAVSDACFFEKRPLVTAAVGRFDASITTLKPYEKGTDGAPNPTYRCLFHEPPPDALLPACAEVGILGALTGIVGALQALEVIKEIAGIGEGLVGRLLLFDARDLRFETIRYGWDPANPLTGAEVSSPAA